MSNSTIKKNFTDRLSYFLKKKFKFIIISLIVIFIFLLSFIFYKNLQEKNDIKIAEQYSSASILLKQKKIKEGSFLLETIINKDHHFYSPLALYLLIDSKIEKDGSKIIIFFDKILKNSSIKDENINLIKIKKAIYLISLDNEELIVKTLNPIINSSSVWRNLAINLISDYFLSKNEKIKSKEYMKLLINETNN
tara:strand:+ start:413 stop:994 length:582 start_codon:yes stop_codon:yes gene_type:complete